MVHKTLCTLILILSVVQLYSCASINPRTTFPMDSLNLVTLLGRKYFFSENQLNWMDALTFCEKYGMELLKVDTVEKNMVITNYLDTLPYGKYYFSISGHRIGRGNNFMWADGTFIDWTIQEWCSGEPNDDRGVEHCMGYFYKNNIFCWSDIPCGPFMIDISISLAYHFICEETI